MTRHHCQHLKQLAEKLEHHAGSDYEFQTDVAAELRMLATAVLEEDLIMKFAAKINALDAALTQAYADKKALKTKADLYDAAVAGDLLADASDVASLNTPFPVDPTVSTDTTASDPAAAEAKAAADKRAADQAAADQAASLLNQTRSNSTVQPGFASLNGLLTDLVGKTLYTHTGTDPVDPVQWPSAGNYTTGPVYRYLGDVNQGDTNGTIVAGWSTVSVAAPSAVIGL